MEGDPFAIVEAMAIAAMAAGCAKGFVYIRDEYPLARRRMANAIARSRDAGWLDIDVEVRRGAGAYICGEETALFNSIEGKRGEPRNKPPFPVDVGLFGRPTLVNNVETLVNVLDVVNGTFQDTRLFCVSGHVERAGVYDVPMGTPLRTLLEQAGAREVQAVLLGGAAGSFVTGDQLDVPLSFEGTRAIGATLGSGSVIVFGQTTDMRQVLLRIARFFRDESCGQCVPCRVGTKRQEEILERMFANGRDRTDVMLLTDIAQAMRDASICGLGQTAANAIASGLQQLPVLNG
jgi:NADH-quinone oxidoreductase subunit F